MMMVGWLTVDGRLALAGGMVAASLGRRVTFLKGFEEPEWVPQCLVGWHGSTARKVPISLQKCEANEILSNLLATDEHQNSGFDRFSELFENSGDVHVSGYFRAATYFISQLMKDSTVKLSISRLSFSKAINSINKLG